MANEEQLELLKQGVQVWNQWKRDHPEIGPDLRGADLGGADLGGVNLWRALQLHFLGGR
jgi:hypothetical protein